MRISVIGAGYLGTTHAAAMASLGHEVVAVDTSSSRVESLQAGVVPFFEPGLQALVSSQLASGQLRFTTSIAAVSSAAVHFVCVGTPQQAGSHAADLSYLDAAFAALLPHLREGAVVVGKSTVPVGTAARLAPPVARSGGELVWNPEFLREGFAVRDTLSPDRVVLGIEGPTGEVAMKEAYAAIFDAGTPVIVTDYATAELVKLAANSFLATKISFINAMAEVCEATGADVTRLADALGYDGRIGPQFLRAGLGFGGGCLPKDLRAFVASASSLGVELSLLRCADEINLRRRSRMVALTRAVCGGVLSGRRLAVLGASFKPDSDDIRDSPALSVAEQLRAAGAIVTVYDPQAMANARRVYPSLDYAPSALTACADADAVLHLTEWSEFRSLSPDNLAAVVRCRRMLDGRNVLDPARWRAAGWTFHALGRQ